MNSSVGAVGGAAAVMVVVAEAVVEFDLLWEILARFAPGSETLCGPWASHRSGIWVPGTPPKD